MTYFTQFQKADYVLADNVVKKLTNISQYTEIFSRIADDISFYTYYNARPDQRFDTISNELYNTPDYYWTIPILNDSIINTWRDSVRGIPALNDLLTKKYPGKALIVDRESDIIGKFKIGEYLLYSNSDVYILRRKYPSLNYLQVEPTELSDLPDTPQTEENEIVGVDSGSVVPIISIIDWPLAPAKFVDFNDNVVPWYVENAIPISIGQVERDLNEARGKLKVIRPEYIEAVVTRFEQEMRVDE
jgi:hypothetical protein